MIEHLSQPRAMLRQMMEVVAPDGDILLSTPNFAHWYPRLRVALGLFDYDRRGILDETHLRFFTRRSLLRMVRAVGLEVKELRYTGLPFEVVHRGTGIGSRIMLGLSRALVRLRPTLFGYEFVLRLRPHSAGLVIHLD